MVWFQPINQKYSATPWPAHARGNSGLQASAEFQSLENVFFFGGGMVKPPNLKPWNHHKTSKTFGRHDDLWWCSDSWNMLRKPLTEYLHRGKSLHVYRMWKTIANTKGLKTRSQMINAQFGRKYVMIHQAGKSDCPEVPLNNLSWQRPVGWCRSSQFIPGGWWKKGEHTAEISRVSEAMPNNGGKIWFSTLQHQHTSTK